MANKVTPEKARLALVREFSVFCAAFSLAVAVSILAFYLLAIFVSKII